MAVLAGATCWAAPAAGAQPLLASGGPPATGSAQTQSQTQSQTQAQAQTQGASSSAALAGPVIDEVALHSDQIAVVTLHYQGPVNAALSQLRADQTSVADDQQTLALDVQAATDAARAEAAAVHTLSSTSSAHSAAIAAHARAEQELANDRARLHGVAVQLYEGVPMPGASTLSAAVPVKDVSATAALRSAQEAAFAKVLIQAATNSIDDHVKSDAAQVVATSRQEVQLAQAMARDSNAVAADRLSVSRDTTAVNATRAALQAAQQSVSAAQVALSGAQSALEQAVAAMAGTMHRPAAPGDSSPSILGPSALTAAELVSWFNASGYADLTSTPISQLAQWYISEGKAEGVRGDLAFAQAVLETGGFSSPDAVNLNNYAGIGHCDTCSAGWKFPSPQMGVRGQIQLLRAYAEPGLTAAQLSNPPVIAQLAPQVQIARGCCATWQSLTGVWATDPIYGPVILGIYQQMLDWALTASPSKAPGSNPPPGG